MMLRRVFSGCCLVGLLAGAALAEMPKQPYPAVIYTHEESKDPPQKLYIAQIDLTNPNVRVRVANGGEDPDGPGKWQTILAQPTKVAEREGFDVVVNGDFFTHLNGKDAEGAAALKEFTKGTPAAVLGPAVTDGKVWSTTQPARPALVVHKDNRVTFEEVADPPSDAVQVMGAHDVLVRAGKNVAPKGKGFPNGPHPRTAVGTAEKGKVLVLVVGDGRAPGEAKGWALSDLADVMIKLGCDEAVNLDGGGSSVMGIRDPKTKKMQIMNKPSDGRERSVGNVLGVSVTPKGSR
jgi:exopolysaccharide biosynthesis protein